MNFKNIIGTGFLLAVLIISSISIFQSGKLKNEFRALMSSFEVKDVPIDSTFKHLIQVDSNIIDAFIRVRNFAVLNREISLVLIDELGFRDTYIDSLIIQKREDLKKVKNE